LRRVALRGVGTAGTEGVGFGPRRIERWISRAQTD
jgi:hypothetical protein